MAEINNDFKLVRTMPNPQKSKILKSLPLDKRFDMAMDYLGTADIFTYEERDKLYEILSQKEHEIFDMRYGLNGEDPKTVHQIDDIFKTKNSARTLFYLKRILRKRYMQRKAKLDKTQIESSEDYKTYKNLKRFFIYLFNLEKRKNYARNDLLIDRIYEEGKISEVLTEVYKLLEHVRVQNQDVMNIYFGFKNFETKTYREIGETSGITRSAVEQKIKKSFNRIRKFSDVETFKKYIEE